MENNNSKAVLILRNKILDKFKELETKLKKENYPVREQRKIKIEISRMAAIVVNKGEYDKIFEEFGGEARLGKLKINSTDKTIIAVRAEARKILKEIYETITAGQYTAEELSKVMDELLRIDTIIAKREVPINQKALEKTFNLDR